MTNHSEAAGGSGEPTITLRSPAELADALPYLMGFHPDGSVVLVASHGDRRTFGGRVRLGIPDQEEDWPSIAEQLVTCLVTGSERRVARPDGVVVFLCQDPRDGESAQQAMERLRPLAAALCAACGNAGITVDEALCLSAGRYWSYVCRDARCCPPTGAPMALQGTSVTAAAATYAGLPMHGSLRQMKARFAPRRGGGVADQKSTLDAASSALVPRMLSDNEGELVARETIATAAGMMARLRTAPPVGGVLEADLRDDQLIGDREAADVILGLQVRETRDRAAEWMEGEEAVLALRLWRALARRCVAPYMEFATAPLALAGWVAWSLDDEPEARVALGLALELDPVYTFAQLLHRACNQGLDVEEVRQCLRDQLRTRDARSTARVAGALPGPGEGDRPQLLVPDWQSMSGVWRRDTHGSRTARDPEAEGRKPESPLVSRPGEAPASSAEPGAPTGKPGGCQAHHRPAKGSATRRPPGSATRRKGRTRPDTRVDPDLAGRLKRNIARRGPAGATGGGPRRRGGGPSAGRRPGGPGRRSGGSSSAGGDQGNGK
ncbi:DUF4192 domain-containing protein [Streptomyces boluensis]|uniref:DUF4192 domain-containing protein n=1 Tax=Streptomyces boluensis TaxID=1775135 RepID=UPI0016528739|nr:DUF4192 domain-containing protein [Streptomyces boluensis]